MSRTIGRRALFGAAFMMVAGGAAVALAQQGPGLGAGPGMMGGGGMMRGGWNAAGYLDSLKSELAITEKQQPAWQDYADTVTGVQQQMQGLHQNMFNQMGTATWEERRDLMNQMFQARQQAFATVHEAATKLVASLDPAQQARAQTMLPGLGWRVGLGRGPGMMQTN